MVVLPSLPISIALIKYYHSGLSEHFPREVTEFIILIVQLSFLEFVQW